MRNTKQSGQRDPLEAQAPAVFPRQQEEGLGPQVQAGCVAPPAGRLGAVLEDYQIGWIEGAAEFGGQN